MIMTVPGAVLLPKRKFKHIKLHCKCNSRILNHSGILGEDYIQYSLYECIGCGLTVTVPDFWGSPFTPTLTITVRDNPMSKNESISNRSDSALAPGVSLRP